MTVKLVIKILLGMLIIPAGILISGGSGMMAIGMFYIQLFVIGFILIGVYC